MPLKLGNRVTVRPLPEGHPLAHRAGKVGEIDGIQDDLYLVDDQLRQGKREGRLEMRDWFREEELELG
jgi:hypothetical protein